MSIRRVVVGLLVLCAVFIVLSCAGLTSDFDTSLFKNVDGLLLLLICLLMAGIFSLMTYVLLKETGLLPALHRKAARIPQGVSGAKPEEKSRQEQAAGITR